MIPKKDYTDYEILYDSGNGATIPNSSLTINLSKNPVTQKYRFLVVQIMNSFAREFLVTIPFYEFTETNHHYSVISALNSNELTILRVSPNFAENKIILAYDKYGNGLNIRKIVGVY